ERWAATSAQFWYSGAPPSASSGAVSVSSTVWSGVVPLVSACSSSGCSLPGCSSPGCSSPGCSSPGCSSPGCSSPGCSSPGCSSPGVSSSSSSPGVSSPSVVDVVGSGSGSHSGTLMVENARE